MNLEKLINPLVTAKIKGVINVDINGIEVDSRRVKKGNLFLCVPGFTADGHDYAKSAIDNGAVALICERELPFNVPQIIVNNSRRAMAIISDLYYNRPSHNLKVIGVTGTNGKTTTTHLIEKILSDQGYLSGLIGTIKIRIGNQTFDVKNTTPEAIDLQRNLAQMVEVGSDYGIMEVSSHALDIGRVRGINYHIGVFTNLTQDHLDYHKTMDKYREAKGLLFSHLGNIYHYNPFDNKYAVLNVDDDASGYFQSITAAQIITYGINHLADVMAKNISISSQGTSFSLESYKGNIDIHLKLIGKFNVYNALAAITTALIEGVSLEKIKNSLETVQGIDGRFESVFEGQDYAVIVDYAHTPDSLKNLLDTINEFVEGKVYCVFGAGGDRDRSKRPLMGEIAMKHSDYVIVTSDNPRTEDPNQIISDILEGVNKVSSDTSKYIAITDRKEAIKYAIGLAKAKDVILIAGKGHETYQVLKDKVIHFDDREIVRAAIRGE